MLKLNFSKSATKCLQRLPEKHAKQIGSRILALATDPKLVGGEQLKGFEPWLRVKSGEYRIVYFIEDQILYISDIGKRNDDEIYKKLKR